jgi:alpha-glucosidase
MLSGPKLLKLLALLLLTALAAAAQTAPVVLTSPNGALEISFATVRGQSVQAAGGQLAYRVAFHGQPVLQWSNLGLLLEGTPPLGPAVRIESSQPSSQDETWTAVQGKASRIRNHYNAVTVETVEMAANGRRLAIEARAYDDGVAFRYTVPEQPSLKEVRILNEATQFRFSKFANLALISRGFETSNEDDYHELTIGGLHPEYLVNLPVLVEVPGIALHRRAQRRHAAQRLGSGEAPRRRPDGLAFEVGTGRRQRYAAGSGALKWPPGSEEWRAS